MDLEKIKEIAHMRIPDDIPTGDMPGDMIKITDSAIETAGRILPYLYEELENTLKTRPVGRAVVSVYGGSGSGKSTVASVLAYMLSEAWQNCHIISGDNYPRRIPPANDNERLHIFRLGGVRALASDNLLAPRTVGALRELQRENLDADMSLCEKHEWLTTYINGGTKALRSYLGTPEEIDFDEINRLLEAFLNGADSLWFKRMGRDEASIWYDSVDMTGKSVLLLEWTHGNSRYLNHIDIPVYLSSTPGETLADRVLRGRDPESDSKFTETVLSLEQELLLSQADTARIIAGRDGTVNCK